MRFLLLAIPFLLRIQAQLVPSANCPAPIYLTQSDVTPWVGITVDTTQKADFVNGLNLFKCSPDTLFVYLVNGVLTRQNWWIACSNTATNGWRVRDAGSKNSAYGTIPVGCVKPTCTNLALYDGTESIFSENPSLQFVPAPQPTMATNGPFQLICPAGSIFGFAATPTAMTLDSTMKITCESGGWAAKTTSNPAGRIISQGTKYGCFSGTTSGTVPLKAAPAAPSCNCPFEDLGAALNLAPPTSTCVNGINQVLSCDQKIYVNNGTELAEFDRVSCSAGKWQATSCDGSIIALSSTTLSVKCGVLAEPPFILPNRGGLRYSGSTADGWSRYECTDANHYVRLRMSSYGGYNAFGKFIDCKDGNCRIASTNKKYQEIGIDMKNIVRVGCYDHGTLNDVCSIPWGNGAFIRDGTIRCEKGFYPRFVTFYDSNNVHKEYNAAQYSFTSASCDSYGWVLPGEFWGVQLTSFWCMGVPAHGAPNDESSGNCKALQFAPDNMQFTSKSREYHCWRGEAENLIVRTPQGEKVGTKLTCAGGKWSLETASGVVAIAGDAGTSVSCIPKNMGVLPADALSLIYAGTTTDGLTRWTCFNGAISMAIGNNLVHTPYIECNNTYYRFASSVPQYYENNADFYGLSSNPIKSVSCVDVGPKYSACTEPWSVGGTRDSNTFKCRQGLNLKAVDTIDKFGAKYTLSAQNYVEMKSMQCHKDGWQVQGTMQTGARVTGFTCE